MNCAKHPEKHFPHTWLSNMPVPSPFSQVEAEQETACLKLSAHPEPWTAASLELSFILAAHPGSRSCLGPEDL